MRNSVKAGIVVPQYVNLTIYEYGFSATIAFHISEGMISFIQKFVDKTKSTADESYYIFSKNNKKAKRLYYLGWRRSEKNLNAIPQICWGEAPKAKNKLKVILREAEIASLKEEIDNINTLF